MSDLSVHSDLIKHNGLFSRLLSFWRRQWDMCFILALVFSFFLGSFGISVLDPRNINLVIRGGDFTNCYLGSVFFRLDEWRWPLLTMQNLGYPFGMSAYGTDIGPLFSLIFKVLHKFFGFSPELQFTGIWLLISYLLQAVASVLIFRHAFHNKWLVVVSSLFFISSPIMLNRVFVHINLLPHFLLLFPILLWMNNKCSTREWCYIALLYSLSFLTCPYFLPMQTVFFVLLWYQKLFVDKEIPWCRFIKWILFLIALCLFWSYILGLFTVGQKLDSGGWRTYGLNLANFVSPVWTRSPVFRRLTPEGVVNYDTDNYLGLGIFLMFLYLFPSLKDLLKRENLRQHWLLSTLLFGLFIYALSPRIRYADFVLVDYDPGKYISWFGNTFRYSCRFFWPIWYLLTFFLIKTLVQKHYKIAWFLLPCLLCIQLWDLYPSYLVKLKFVDAATTYVPTTLKDPVWDKMAEKYHMAFYFSAKQYENLWKWAIKHHKIVNYGFLNRPDPRLLDQVNEVKAQILSGYIDSAYQNYFFVLDDPFVQKLKHLRQYNPNLDPLVKSLVKADNYHILEYSSKLKLPKIFDKPRKIPTRHTGWHADLVQVEKYRLYRSLPNNLKYHGTIITFTDSTLIIDWDLWGEEKFQKKEDGVYHFVPKTK